MKRQNNHILNRKIKELPGYLPPPEIWNEIEKDLLFEKQLDDKIKDLQGYKPDDKIWESIDKKLAQVTLKIKVKKQGYKSIWVYSGVAATILTFLFIGTMAILNKTKEKVSYSEEIAYKEDESSIDQSSELKAIDFIKIQCKVNEKVCSSPDFQDRMKELKDLNLELDKVMKMQQQSGSSESLTKSQIRLVNFRSQLIKELISNLTS